MSPYRSVSAFSCQLILSFHLVFSHSEIGCSRDKIFPVVGHGLSVSMRVSYCMRSFLYATTDVKPLTTHEMKPLGTNSPLLSL